MCHTHCHIESSFHSYRYFYSSSKPFQTTCSRYKYRLTVITPSINVTSCKGNVEVPKDFVFDLSANEIFSTSYPCPCPMSCTFSNRITCRDWFGVPLVLGATETLTCHFRQGLFMKLEAILPTGTSRKRYPQ